MAAKDYVKPFGATTAQQHFDSPSHIMALEKGLLLIVGLVW